MKKFVVILMMLVILNCHAPAFAAANPFLDVPQGHWAYDAVDLLASRGIVSGYPDSAWKGAQPATRYQMASIIARALAVVDFGKASRQDVALLGKLVAEFRDELAALGVAADRIDRRTAVLENRLGGWKINGEFSFDTKFTDSDSGSYYFTENGKKNEFTKNMFYLYLTKHISENTYFYAQYRTGSNSTGGNGRGDQDHLLWSHLYVDTVLPNDIGLRIGRFGVDIEGMNGLYGDNDALFGDYRTDGFMLTKKWNSLSITAVLGRNDGYYVEAPLGIDTGSTMNYALDLNWRPNEKFVLGATGYWFHADAAAVSGNAVDGDFDVNAYGIYAIYKFTPFISLKGVYYLEDLGYNVPAYYAGVLAGDTEDSPQAWKAVLDIKQECLKFTGLWIEYARQDNTFIGYNNRYSIGGGAGNYDYVGRNMNYADPLGTSEWWLIKAYQKWNEKWGSFVRFANVDYDTGWLEDATECGIGLTYQYTPAINFELVYDRVDHGDNGSGAAWGTESVVRFRTGVTF